MKLYQKLALIVGMSTLGYTAQGQEHATIKDSSNSIPMETRSGLASIEGQFTKDNNLDYIIAAIKPGHNQADMYLVIGNGDGTFSEKKYIGSIPANTRSGISLLKGDFDKDGDVDLIAAAEAPGYNQAGTYTWFNKGMGNFSLKND